MFFWKEEYNTGIDDIDKQHKELFRISSEAYKLLKNDLRTDKYDNLIKIISDLRDYTIYHFNYEENRMAEKKCKGFFAHKLEHEAFKEKINSIDLKSIDFRQDESITELLELVYNWITDHILNTDKGYVGTL
ncbi:MAG: bacteriohemerythrin [Clostridiaceae bacterium]